MPRALALSAAPTAKMCLCTTRRLRPTASARFRKVRQSSSTWSRDPRAGRLKTSRLANATERLGRGCLAAFFPFFVSVLEKRENAYRIPQVQSDSDLVLVYEGAGK